MKRKAVIVTLYLLWAAGCASSDELDRPARTTIYETGRPVFNLEASQQWQAGEGRIVVRLGLPRAVLTYVKSGSTYVATHETTVRVRPEDETSVAASTSFSDTIRVRSHEDTRTFESIYYRRALNVEPGTYVAEATVIDGETDEAVTRRQRVHVAAPEEGAAVSDLRLTARSDSGNARRPVLSRYLAGQPDSLRAAVSLHHLRRADTARVSMRLLRFPHDSTAARPPHWLTPSRGSLAYWGVRFDRADTLQRTRRSLARPEASLRFAFALPDLRRGLYRVEVAARAGGREPVRRSRTFSVRAPAFPRVETIKQMTQALAYITSEDEMARLRAPDSTSALKRRFDEFWGKLIPQKQRAADAVRRYFSRVEEANRRFTTFEAGWKTDRGMLYVLFGAPLYVEDRGTTLRWHYSYNERDPRDVFVFEEVPTSEGESDFEHYVLQRQSFYERPWRRALKRWREGELQ